MNLTGNLAETTLGDLSAHVERENEKALKRKELEAEQAMTAVVVEAREKILKIFSREPLSPPHLYEPYGNPKVNKGCVRCPYPRSHEVHVEE